MCNGLARDGAAPTLTLNSISQLKQLKKWLTEEEKAFGDRLVDVLFVVVVVAVASAVVVSVLTLFLAVVSVSNGNQTMEP